MYDKTQLQTIESEIKSMWERGEIRVPLHLSGGNESELIEIFKEVKRDDYIFVGHRHHYHYLLHGATPDELISSISKGRAGSMGTIDRGRNFYASAIVGGVCGIGVGVAWALRESESKKHVWCFVGDGVVDGGHFWEALQYAVGYDLPITFVIEHNDRATCTDVVSRLGTGHLQLDPSYAKHLRIYGYQPEYPHVGSGNYVAF